MLDHHSVAIGGEGLELGQSPGLFPFVFRAGAPCADAPESATTNSWHRLGWYALSAGLVCRTWTTTSTNTSLSFMKNLKFEESNRSHPITL